MDNSAQHQLFFRNRLKKQLSRLSKQARRFGLDCYRLYDRDLPEVPLTVDIYGDYVRIHDFRYQQDESLWLEKMTAVIAEVVGLPGDHIFVKSRHTRALGQYGSDQRGITAVVGEQGLRFEINLSDYADTGLFCDHRITRDMVRKKAGGGHFLNLFSYTGAFTVYAADGGAVRTDSVDLSRVYNSWAARNLDLNGLYGPRHRFFTGGWEEFFGEVRDRRYDLAVVDPPTFSVSKKTENVFDVKKDHVRLLNSVFSRMRPGGEVIFSTNRKSFKLLDKELQAREIRDITPETIPFDFQLHRPHRCWLFLL